MRTSSFLAPLLAIGLAAHVRRQGLQVAPLVMQAIPLIPATRVPQHRAAIEHGAATQHGIVGMDVHLRQHFAQGVIRGLVDQHAHGTAFIVLADQRHAAREIRIGQRWQGDQKLVGKWCAERGHVGILSSVR